MSREDALRQLFDIRQEIILIHNKTDECRYFRDKVESLKNEKDNPVPPKYSLKPENTAEKLKREFEEQNSRKYTYDATGIKTAKIINIIALAVVVALFAADGFCKLGIGIHNENATTQHIIVSLFMHFISSAVVGAIPFAFNNVRCFLRSRSFIIKAMFTIGIIFVVMLEFIGLELSGAWLYGILMLLCLVLTLISIGVIKCVNIGKAQKPSLTKAQREELETARKQDELAKKQNAETRIETDKKLEEQRNRRLPQIDREIKENIENFDASRQQLDKHMENLEKMDALCEEDKQLQIVELLIRFINTRRADTIKEALQEYDKLMMNQQMLEIERQKLAAELQRISQERDAQKKQLEQQIRHQTEMEYLARDSAKSRADAVKEIQSIGTILYYDLHY